MSALDAAHVVDSLSDGIYTCDLDRRITYWSRSAERITGWKASEVVGRRCRDNILCHVDKDGHTLCGEEHCPLHRAMITGEASAEPLLVYAQGREGQRIPTQVSVSPVRDADGKVIGGVETFRDATGEQRDLERAKAIQELSLQHELPRDDRIRFTTHYIPHAIIGGDFYAIEPLDDDRYALFLADVTGHGVPAALYTMHLSQLWEHHHREISDPSAFAARVNDELVRVFKSEGSFATAVCATIDLERGLFRFASAGGPAPVVWRHDDGRHECLALPGFPLGLFDGATFEATETELASGDRLLLFSDGAVEVLDADLNQLGVNGLVHVLREQGYPASDIDMQRLEEDLLRFSNAIRLPDDLTLVECLVG
jgi:PAS domain S-box-containing protein